MWLKKPNSCRFHPPVVTKKRHFNGCPLATKEFHHTVEIRSFSSAILTLMIVSNENRWLAIVIYTVPCSDIIGWRRLWPVENEPESLQSGWVCRRMCVAWVLNKGIYWATHCQRASVRLAPRGIVFFFLVSQLSGLRLLPGIRDWLPISSLCSTTKLGDFVLLIRFWGRMALVLTPPYFHTRQSHPPTPLTCTACWRHGTRHAEPDLRTSIIRPPHDDAILFLHVHAWIFYFFFPAFHFFFFFCCCLCLVP